MALELKEPWAPLEKRGPVWGESKGQKVCLGHLWNSEKEAGVAEAVLAREKQEKMRVW